MDIMDIIYYVKEMLIENRGCMVLWGSSDV